MGNKVLKRKETKIYYSMVQKSKEAITIINLDGTFNFANESAIRCFCVPSLEYLFNHDIYTISPKNQPFLLKDSQSTFDSILQKLNSENEENWLDCSAISLTINNKQVIQVLLIEIFPMNQEKLEELRKDFELGIFNQEIEDLIRSSFYPLLKNNKKQNSTPKIAKKRSVSVAYPSNQLQSKSDSNINFNLTQIKMIMKMLIILKLKMINIFLNQHLVILNLKH
ncbi:hypothetical protein M0811_08734 [Anaeramoeba ignava]|uniref:PAS domain-containing protein n=1 Tax=Anaeramoeba ignava TaxID=1746090 RepID=A0A9Q0LH96_ANAIG|nr:hypothetical protein M0811_08734 [Anaeramoeba ignava]